VCIIQYVSMYRGGRDGIGSYRGREWGDSHGAWGRAAALGQDLAGCRAGLKKDKEKT
jgi:hypothetical protein